MQKVTHTHTSIPPQLSSRTGVIQSLQVYDHRNRSPASPSSDSNSAILLDSRIELSDSPEDFIEFLKSQIYATELARKGFRSDDITASNSRYTLKKNKVLSHPNLSEIGHRNVRMVRTNNFI